MRRYYFWLLICTSTFMRAQQPRSDLHRGSIIYIDSSARQGMRKEIWTGVIADANSFPNRNGISGGLVAQVYMAKRISLNYHYAIGEAVFFQNSANHRLWLHSPIVFGLLCKNARSLTANSVRPMDYVLYAFGIALSAFIPEGTTLDLKRNKRTCLSVYVNPFGCDYISSFNKDQLIWSFEVGPGFTMTTKKLFVRCHLGAKYLVNRGEFGVSGGLSFGGIFHPVDKSNVGAAINN